MLISPATYYRQVKYLHHLALGKWSTTGAYPTEEIIAQWLLYKSLTILKFFHYRKNLSLTHLSQAQVFSYEQKKTWDL